MEDNKIVIISWKDVDELVLKKLCKCYFKKYKILILDISKILNLNVSQKKILIKNSNVEIKYLKSQDILKKILFKIKPQAIILYMMERYSFKTMKIYNLVKSTGYTMIKILDNVYNR